MSDRERKLKFEVDQNLQLCIQAENEKDRMRAELNAELQTLKYYNLMLMQENAELKRKLNAVGK